jgi:hypothetical protein
MQSKTVLCYYRQKLYYFNKNFKIFYPRIIHHRGSTYPVKRDIQLGG